MELVISGKSQPEILQKYIEKPVTHGEMMIETNKSLKMFNLNFKLSNMKGNYPITPYARQIRNKKLKMTSQQNKSKIDPNGQIKKHRKKQMEIKKQTQQNSKWNPVPGWAPRRTCPESQTCNSPSKDKEQQTPKSNQHKNTCFFLVVSNFMCFFFFNFYVLLLF